MSLWDFVSVEARVWGGAPAKTNYNWFYIFQNCIIYDFGRILNSPAILLNYFRGGLRPHDPLDGAVP